MLLSLLLAGCGGSEAPPPKQQPEPEQASPAPSPPAPAEAAERPDSRNGGGGDAAKVARRYYSLIQSRNYAEAYALREPAENAPTLQAFAANFERHADYRVTVGTPSRSVESGGWIYVEVPVQSYGRFKDGSPLASAGILTLRKREGGQWRIFTKG
jgi:hypothetical protein